MDWIEPRTIHIVVVGAALLLLIVVVAGAIVTIVNQSELSFHSYLTDLTVLGTALIAAVVAAILKLGGRKDDEE